MSTLSPHCSSSFHSPRHLCPSWGLASHHQRPHRACHITGQWQLAAYMMVSSRRRGEGVHTGGSPRVSTTGTGTRGSKTGAAELETSGHWEEIRTGVRGRPDFWRVSWAHGGGPAGLGAKETPGTWARSSGKRPHHTGLRRQCMGPNASVKAEGCDLAEGQPSSGSRVSSSRQLRKFHFL